MQKKNNLRIVMLSPSYPPDYTCEVGRHVYYLSQALAKLGVEVYVIAYSSEGCMETEEVNGVNVHRLNLAIMGKEDRVLAHQSKELVARCLRKLSVLHLIHVHDWRFAPAGKFIRDMYKVPLVATFHQLELTTGNIDRRRPLNTLSTEEKIRRAYSRKVEELTFRDADYFILKSVYLKKKAQELYNLDDNRIDVIFIGNVTEDSEVDTLVDAVFFPTTEENPTTYAARIQQMFGCVPDLFDCTKSLYVGASPKRTQFVEFFQPYSLTILEIFERNVEELKKRFPKCKLILGDVRKADRIFPVKSFEAVIWYHGPEHIQRKELVNTLKKLENIASKLIVLGCPFGIYEQGPHDGNYYEIHRSHLYPNTFKALGYQVSVLGEKDQKGSNILAWKYLPDARSETASKYSVDEEAKATLEVYRKVLGL